MKTHCVQCESRKSVLTSVSTSVLIFLLCVATLLHCINVNIQREMGSAGIFYYA